MTMHTKTEVFVEHLDAYCAAGKKEKERILHHVCFVTNLHRKAAIRKFGVLRRHTSYSTHGKKGRRTVYGVAVTIALKELWNMGSRVCGELLHPMIGEYVAVLMRDRMWHHDTHTTTLLMQMSMATVKRRVSGFEHARTHPHGISSTKPSHIKHLVPIFIGPWKDKPPGYGQLDTVRHSHTASGDAVYTVNYTDAATLTPGLRAQWNKGQEATRASLQYIKHTLPFVLVGAHPDTGSEFINYMMLAWCRQERVEYTRSRPNHKNDNMYVEERNGHAIRKFVGYTTLDCVQAVTALNALYAVLVPYLIHFVAVRRLISRERVGSGYKRTYETVAKTPYQRILEHAAISEEVKMKLKNTHDTLNPLLLKREIERCITMLYATQKRYGTRASG